MTVASFLTKNLLIDWRRGEDCFAVRRVLRRWVPEVGTG
ncbi:FAD-binding domain-containing protein [Agromyces sp. H66]|nr:FAD-binding domain-containing protein [Agromyces sp. H66]